MHTGWPKKLAHFFVRFNFIKNIDQCFNLFHCLNQKNICNNTVTKDPITPQVCRYTTLWKWNISVLKATIENKTSVTKHFKKLTTGNNVLLRDTGLHVTNFVVNAPYSIDRAVGSSSLVRKELCIVWSTHRRHEQHAWSQNDWRHARWSASAFCRSVVAIANHAASTPAIKQRCIIDKHTNCSQQQLHCIQLTAAHTRP